ncbi:CHASE3 domain-containing protein [Rhodoferax sp.]|uniref:CHASE3 domain-containing protein n=1 Tax=Rhodoferax sp. TaxID=50421 RepID=UPI0027552845|nr:CHASE3 domain-containing protein [Rhodoferax sp.]
MGVLTIVKRSPFVFPLACLASTAMMFVSEGSYWQSVGSLDNLSAIQQARTTIRELQHSLLNAETGQRGYLLTKREDYLPPYRTAVSRIAESFNFLEHYYSAQDPASRELLDKLRTLTDAKLSILAEAIRLQDAGSARNASELVLSGIDKEKMDAISQIGNQLLAHETRNVERSRNDIYQTLMLSRLGVTALSAISLLALFLYLRQSVAVERHQLELRNRAQTERDRLELEVGLRTAQLTELAHHLQTAREDERHRLARNLHDDLGALLTSAKLDAARIKSRIGSQAPQALELLAHLVSTLNSSIALGRRIIEDLRPSSLSNLGLVATLEILVGEFAGQTGVAGHCALEPVQLDPTAELMVYRLVQEAITNISKYARAQQVWVKLTERDGKVEISVRDDGIGFDTQAMRSSAYGLVGMRYRVEAQGGTLTVLSAPGQGTEIRATLASATVAATSAP